VMGSYFTLLYSITVNSKFSCFTELLLDFWPTFLLLREASGVAKKVALLTHVPA